MSIDNLLAEVKREIRCVLISSSLQMTVKNLGDDYLDITGSTIPYTKLGFKTLLGFLKSIPDVLQISGNDPKFAIVTPVVTKNLESINSLIMRQKAPDTKKRNRKRPQRRVPKRAEIKQFPARAQQKRYSTSSDDGPSTSRSSPTSARRNVTPIKKVEYSTPKKQQSSTSPTVNNLNYSFKNLHVTSNKSLAVQNLANQTSPKTFFGSEDTASVSGKSSSVEHPDLSHYISNKVRDNLKTLIGSVGAGILLTNLAAQYKSRFGTNLSYTEMGFPNAIEFVSQLQDIFIVERVTDCGDFILFDKRKDVPDQFLDNLRYLASTLKVGHELDTLMQQEDNKSIREVTKLVSHSPIPENVMDSGDELDCLWNSIHFESGQNMNIIITEVYDPCKFWFVIDGDDHFKAMNLLMDEMQDYYEKHQEDLKISNMQENMYCAACYASNWQRGLIARIVSDTKVEIFFIDYGSVVLMDTSVVRYLEKSFQCLPKQAIRGRLDFIIPPNKLKSWPLSICKFFLKQIQERRLYAAFTEVDSEDKIIWMAAKDLEHHKENPNSLSINEILVEQKFAEICMHPFCTTKPHPGNRRMYMDYLLPMFDDLEKGLTYKYSELLALENKKYDHQTVMIGVKNALKQRYKRDYNLDLTDNNFNYCGHFEKNSIIFGKTEEQLRMISEELNLQWPPADEKLVTGRISDHIRHIKKQHKPEPEPESETSSESDYNNKFEYLRVYNIGGHDLHCAVVNYKIYVITEEFVKKLMPAHTVDKIDICLSSLGLRCRHIEITIDSHPEIFKEYQSANIPVVITDDTSLQLTPLKSLDLILYAFKITNTTLAEDIESLYNELSESQ